MSDDIRTRYGALYSAVFPGVPAALRMLIELVPGVGDKRWAEELLAQVEALRGPAAAGGAMKTTAESRAGWAEYANDLLKIDNEDDEAHFIVAITDDIAALEAQLADERARRDRLAHLLLAARSYFGRDAGEKQDALVKAITEALAELAK